MPEPPAADELLSSLSSLLTQRQHVAGLTATEIADAKGWARPYTLTVLRKAAKAGRLTAARAYRMAIDGTQRPVPVYTLRA